MKIEDIKKNAFAMPLTSPSALQIDYSFGNREYLIIAYETDIEALQAVVPEPLKVTSNKVKFEFMKMPDAHGFGSFTEAGQVIEVEFEGKPGTYSHMMFLDDLAPIAAGREIWGFPKKYASPKVEIDVDTLLGTLHYNSVTVAVGTMGFKYQPLDIVAMHKNLTEVPNYLIKIIPHANGKEASLCQLVRYFLKDVTVHGAWTGPAALQLFEHALAPVAKLPVRKVISGTHLIADLTLGFGEVVYDYLKD
ncbi:MAG: acetoacetate decarboxylase [Neisseriales bacterium]|jgi:acetoacetate decarboxylase|nr:MAG: acetoacetate decarboxylase [Neisseriales bacterium]